MRLGIKLQTNNTILLVLSDYIYSHNDYMQKKIEC